MVPSKTKELPPRARRIPGTASVRIGVDGTTSACAENTNFHLIDILSTRNYLRVRGEYPSSAYNNRETTELPPRARRIPARIMQANISLGTTSACAENTPAPWASIWNPWNYLRVRGEYPWNIPPAIYWPELPPRARRIPGPAAVRAPRLGTTSACAENTFR